MNRSSGLFVRIPVAGTLAIGMVLGAMASGVPAAMAQPVDLVPAPAPTQSPRVTVGPATVAAPTQPATSAPQPEMKSEAVVQTIPTDFFDVSPDWSLADGEALLAYIRGIEAEGLFPADYRPVELEAALAAGEGPTLNEAATRSFTWLAQDLRDGRTEMDSRRQWFVRDPDAERLPLKPLLEGALAGGGIAAALDSLAPSHPDYAVLKTMLAETPKEQKEKRALIRANMDRWRWLAQDLGRTYLLTNVPEFQLRMTVNDKVVRSYRTIVGKPGRTATPQLAETVEGVIFNPTWTVPQSIVVGEGLGAKVLNNPSYARAKNYKAWKNADGTTIVVQQPGPTNSLGLVKLDMPNPHAIFLHDTPAKQLFDTENRAYSHGCIRTERALELGLTLAMVLGGLDKEEAVAISASGEYTKVPLEKRIPVYITYFTMARDIDGEMRSFADIYERDKPVLASMAAPRVAKTGKRVTDEPVVAIEEPGA